LGNSKGIFRSPLLDGVLATVRLGWPIVVIKGTGGLADRIAEGRRDPGKFITDPLLTEILQEVSSPSTTRPDPVCFKELGVSVCESRYPGLAGQADRPI
jgi:hypothetical protein